MAQRKRPAFDLIIINQKKKKLDQFFFKRDFSVEVTFRAINIFHVGSRSGVAAGRGLFAVDGVVICAVGVAASS